MFKKILVCLDGSELAEQILPYAVAEALCFQGKLILFQVIHEPVAFSPGIPGAGAAPVQTDAMLRQAKKALDEAREYLEKIAAPLHKKGIKVDAVSILGRAGEAILSYADSNNVNLIAIATHGRRGLERGVFGSVADYVLRESGLPMLVVRPQERKDEG
ncbi:MAG: universal stress protein [Dehalococcoidia bacterium]|nr:universal stress protein [Dehalococcoidia bacterium]